ncbi:MAG: DUF1329 domain-containing protein [Candidatus Binataceae bacterium]
MSRLLLICVLSVACLAALPASAQVRPGDLIGAADANRVKNLVSPGVYLRIVGGMSMKVVPSERIEWPPPYREATEKYAAQVRLTTDRRSLIGYVAGQPFPFIDPNDPDAGTKLMWNNTFRPSSTDDYDSRDFTCVSVYGGLGHRYRPIDSFEFGHLASYNLVGRTEVEPMPVDRDFLTSGRYMLIGFYPFLAPQEDRGRGYVRYRYADPARGDDSWWWIPGNRRLRRMNESFMSSTPGAITWGPDNFQGFLAKNENYDWRFLAERSMLACVNASTIPEAPCPTDGGASACTENWEMRRIYVVQGTARRKRVPEEMYGAHVLYIDSEAVSVVYQDLYDRRGELWRNYTRWTAYRDRPVPDARVAIYPFKRVFQAAASIADLKSGFASTCYSPAPDTAERESWYINMGAVDKSFFSTQAMAAAAP